MVVVVSYAALAATVLIAVTGYTALRAGDQWNPLGEFPVQQVIAPGPFSISAGDTIPIDATLCWGDAPVNATAEIVWVRLEPGGFRIEAFTSVRDHAAGCESGHFENVMPEGIQPGTWIITGLVTPLREQGTGVPRAWETTRFEVVE